MFSVSAIKPVSLSEPSFIIRRTFYSRFSCSDFKFSPVKNNFRETIKVFSKQFLPRYESFKASNNVKQHSAKILKTWSQQFEFVISDRIRRSLQLISLYKKWWGDFTTNLYLQRLASEMLKRKSLYFTACLAPLFQWENKRIAEDEFSKLKNEIDNAREFKDEKVNQNSNKYDSNNCSCNRCKHLADDEWSLFFIGRTFKIWRKEHVDYPGQGLYVYKVYGAFPDVTANDFFRVQIDTNYRKEWDPNSVELNIVESDNKTNSDIIYWEFLFPRMFYNRDYVCNRRFEIDEERKLLTIISESVEHPSCPTKPPLHRVKEYWSHIVIRSTSGNLDEPGIEFTITYFDNPELTIQNYLTIWYATFGMSEYIEQQRWAALNLAKRAEEAKKKTEIEKEIISEAKPKKEIQQNVPEKRILLF